MGMFDDLVPETPPTDDATVGGVLGPADVAPPARTGMFDDLLPVKGIDWTLPADEIREAIAAAPEAKRKALHDAWADYRISQSKLPLLPDAARGIPIIGALTDEMTGAAQAGLHSISGGRLGAPYDEAVAEERARQRAIHKKNPILAPMTELAGGAAAAGPIFARMSRATTLPGQMAEGVAIGAPLAGAEGLLSEGSAEDRVKEAGERLLPGAVVGAVAPVALRGVGSAVSKTADVLSPQIARAQGALHGLRERLAIKASADGSAGHNVSPGADAAADQIIANQLARANVTVPELRRRFQEAQEAARFDANSRAQNVLAPVDIDPSLQRLAGSVARQQPEAGNIGASFQYARQTGQPSGMMDIDGIPMPGPSSNIPTRPAMAKPGPDDVPMGQYERVADAMKRAFQIQDHAQHGHGKTAHQTEKLVINRAKADGAKLYGDANRAAEGYDIRPHIQPVLDKWRQIAADEPRAVGHAINTMLRQFESKNGVVESLPKFQKAKEFADGMISNWLKGPSRNKYVGGRLNELQRELLASVDDIKPNGIGEAYKTARDTFAGEAKLLEALKLGRETMREDSEVVIDHLRDLATEGERKMFRLGLYEAFRQAAARKGRTHDVTQLLATPRMQEILAEAIPRPRNPNAVFANRPERFGQYVQSEQRMIQTRNQTMGNSKTAERMQDDEALNNMQSMIEAAKKAAPNMSTTGMIVGAMETALSKLFGFRADTAAAIARKLYTAAPLEREVLLSRIEQRMGPGRAAQFARVVNELSRGAGAPLASGYTSSGLE